jgi:hypothetical protein
MLRVSAPYLPGTLAEIAAIFIVRRRSFVLTIVILPD